MEAALIRFSHLRSHPVPRAVLAGVLLTILQVLFTLSVQRLPLRTAYERLFQWDSEWYRDIAENGYSSIVPPAPLHEILTDSEFVRATNVAFFPGYPLLSRAVKSVTRLPWIIAMAVTAQLANVAMWAYVLLLLTRWRATRTIKAGVIIGILANPSAFFLIAPYSESLFLATVLGMLYWQEHSGARPQIIAGLHGLVMTLTRITGAPLALAPLIGGFFRQGSAASSSARKTVLFSEWKFRTIAAAIGVAGVLAFFLYCAVRFGHWDLYVQRQWRGWGVKADTLFFLRKPEYLLYPQVRSWFFAADQLSITATSLTFWLLIALIVFDAVRSYRRQAGSRWVRIPYYWCAFWTFFLHASALSNRSMISMIRYVMPVHVLLLLAAAHLLAIEPLSLPRTWRVITIIAGLLVVAALIALQILIASRYTQGVWVA